jgi:hypothetical protein
LDQVKRRSAVRQHAAEFAVEISVMRGQPGDGLGDGRVFFRPVVAAARENVHSARIKPAGPSGASFTSAASCGLIQDGGCSAPTGGSRDMRADRAFVGMSG